MISPENTDALKQNSKRSIACVVRKRRLDDPNDDVANWRSRPPEERIAALEEIRSEYHRWMGLTETRMVNVVTIVDQKPPATPRL